MKNIYQLKNVAKRLPRLKRLSQQILAKGRRGGRELSDKEVGFHNMRVLACDQGLRLLGLEFLSRRIGQQAPFRDATTFRLRRRPA